MAKSRNNYIYTRRRIKRKGVLDGRGFRWVIPFLWKKDYPVYPSSEQEEPPQFEEELLALAKNYMSREYDAWQAADSGLYERFRLAENELEQSADQLQHDKKEESAARQRYERLRESFFELPSPEFPPKVTMIILVILGILEFPFTKFIFELMNATPVETYFMAATACLGIPLAAHTLGQTLKKDEKELPDKLQGYGLAIAVFLVFIGIMIVRSVILEEEAVLGDLNPMTASIIFLGVNAMVFLLATNLSYKSAHTDPVLFNSRNGLLEDAEEIWAEEDREKLLAIKRYENAQNAYDQARARRKQAFRKSLTQMYDYVENLELYIQVYRRYNLQARKIVEKPICFLAEPETAELKEIIKKLRKRGLESDLLDEKTASEEDQTIDAHN